jgi:hypothetical protein
MLLDTIAIAFWPTIVGLLAFGWFRRRDDGTLALTWTAAASLIVTGLFCLTLFDIGSLLILLDIFIGAILFGSLCVLAAYLGRDRLTPPRRLATALFGIAIAGYGGQSAIGDYLLERPAVDAVVRQLRIQETAKGPNEYLVTIGDETFKVTTGLYATLREGDRVRATIGRGSGYIYTLEMM